jgi:hypothetical protein
MTNAPELLSRLREVGRCMGLASASAADEVRTASRALADTTEAESPEIAAAGVDLAKAAEAVGDGHSNLLMHLRLQILMVRIQTAAESSQAGRIWAAAQNLAELLLVVGKFLDRAPEPHWSEEFPPALCGLDAVRFEFSNLVSVLGWPTPDQFGLKEIDQALRHADQLIDPAPEAPLCQYLASARRDLVRPTHIAWIESHLANDHEPSPSPAQVYGWYWNETLGESALDGAKVAESAATASALAQAMGLDEVVEHLGDPDRVAFYGMMNILPATPIRWSLENDEAARRHLHYGLARWYRVPLEASFVPIDVITGVLRTRRPYYYHRMLAHALLQTVCVQRVLPPGYVADAIVGKLTAFCDLMLDGYRLRCRYLPRMKTTEGWVEYLDALVGLHFPDGQAAPCALSGSGPTIYAALAKVLYGRPN